MGNHEFDWGVDTLSRRIDSLPQHARLRVALGPHGSKGADLSLSVNASVEYAGRARKSPTEPWVHLLAQQDIQPASCRVGSDAGPVDTAADDQQVGGRSRELFE